MSQLCKWRDSGVIILQKDKCPCKVSEHESCNKMYKFQNKIS